MPESLAGWALLGDSKAVSSVKRTKNCGSLHIGVGVGIGVEVFFHHEEKKGEARRCVVHQATVNKVNRVHGVHDPNANHKLNKIHEKMSKMVCVVGVFRGFNSSALICPAYTRAVPKLKIIGILLSNPWMDASTFHPILGSPRLMILAIRKIRCDSWGNRQR